MKMKKAMSVALASAAMLVGGNAHAALANDSLSGNGNLFFSAWDATTQTGYVQDLGIRLDAFLSSFGITDVTTGAVTTPATLSFAIDPLFTATFNASQLSTIKWNIAGGDTTGNSAITGDWRIISSLNKSALAPSGANSGFNQLGGNMFAYENANNINHPGVTSFVVSGNATPTPTEYPGNTASWDINFGGSGLIADNTGTGIGDILNTALMTGGGGNSRTLMKSNIVQGAGGALLEWKVANGQLVASATVVPVPAALWLLGSALTGLVTIGRRKSQA